MPASRRPILPAVLLLCAGLACALAGCSHTPPALANAPCNGDRSVRVHNESDGPIDVYLQTGRPAGQLLGTAPVGGAEFELPPLDPAASFWFQAQGSGGTEIMRAFGRRAYSRITYDIVCHDGRDSRLGR